MLRNSQVTVSHLRIFQHCNLPLKNYLDQSYISATRPTFITFPFITYSQIIVCHLRDFLITANQMLGLLDAVTFQVAEIWNLQTVNPLVQLLQLGTGRRPPNNSIRKCLLCCHSKQYITPTFTQ